MIRTCILLAAAAWAAEASLVVVPGSLASVEGNNSNTGILGPNGRTFQYAYDSSVLSIQPGDKLIGMAFRLTQSAGAITGPLSWTLFDIQISSSKASPGYLSNTFASNVGSDAVNVRSGALSFAAGAFPSGHAPNSFGPEISFSTPFTYSGGDLLLTVRTNGNTQGTTVAVDAEGNLLGKYQGFGSTVGSSATVGNGATTTTVVLAFDVQSGVPEPGTALLMLSGVWAALWYAGRARKRFDVDPSTGESTVTRSAA